MENFVIKNNGRYHVNNAVHGHPKNSLCIDDAKKYTSLQSATKAAKHVYGNMADFKIITLPVMT